MRPTRTRRDAAAFTGAALLDFGRRTLGVAAREQAQTGKAGVIVQIVLAADTRAASRVTRALPEGDAAVPWLFLGADHQIAAQWAGLLGLAFERASIARVLDDAARDIRTPFLAWLDGLNARYGRSLSWWCGQFSERNTLVSPLFRHVCYLEVVRGLMRANQMPGLIVAETPGLLAALAEVVRDAGGLPRTGSRWRRTAGRVWEDVRVLLAPAYFLVFNAAPRAWAARRSCAGRRPRLDGDAKRPIILKTYLHAGDIAGDGTFRDRYLPHLHEFLAARRETVWTVAHLCDATPSIRIQYERMRRSSARFIVPEDWLTWSDMLAAAVDGLRLRRGPRPLARLVELDLRALVREECRRQAGSSAPREASLLGRLPGRLHAAGLAPAQVIGWWEHQAVDKAFILGCRSAFGVPITGVQGVSLSPNHLNLFPTAGDCALRVAPDRVVCTGPLAAEVLKAESAGQLQVVAGCALRYAFLWQTPLARGARGEDPACRIVVALPLLPRIAAQVLDLLQVVMRRRPEILWSVRPHPDHDRAVVRTWLAPDLRDRVRMMDGPDRLAATDVLVTSASAIALEAVAAGVPVIQIGSATELNFDPLAWSGAGLARRCFSSEEVESELARLQALSPGERAALGEAGAVVMAAWFAPVSDAALQRFLA